MIQAHNSIPLSHRFKKSFSHDMKAPYRIVYQMDGEEFSLKPFLPHMAQELASIANDERVQATDINFSLPFLPEHALEAIKRYIFEWNQNNCYHFAIFSDKLSNERKQELIGCISLRVHTSHLMADLGYWLGYNYWNKGICTKVASEMVKFAFIEFNAQKIYAQHMGNNPASGRVMQKIGMQQEGYLREHWLKDGVRQDLVTYGMLRHELDQWLAQ
jgi:ribosomal-protein-alanine N-acetyltransferase